jgi:hypothetical protein
MKGGSKGTIQECLFDGSIAQNGGAIYILNSEATVKGSTFHENLAQDTQTTGEANGGALSCSSNVPTCISKKVHSSTTKPLGQGLQMVVQCIPIQVISPFLSAFSSHRSHQTAMVVPSTYLPAGWKHGG